MKFIGIAITIAVFASCLIAGAEEEQAPGSWAVNPGITAAYNNGQRVRPQPAIETEEAWRVSPGIKAHLSNGVRPQPAIETEQAWRVSPGIKAHLSNGKPIYSASFGFP